ncbi:MAG: hypothetical protein J3K34DRAFT_438062 [Monoraphidium minutum]|nr:MAG: hypothetical protein J3K34DRAFT_438062 [Monoraphidium minutum]
MRTASFGFEKRVPGDSSTYAKAAGTNPLLASGPAGGRPWRVSHFRGHLVTRKPPRAPPAVPRAAAQAGRASGRASGAALRAPAAPGAEGGRQGHERGHSSASAEHLGDALGGAPLLGLRIPWAGLRVRVGRGFGAFGAAKLLKHRAGLGRLLAVAVARRAPALAVALLDDVLVLHLHALPHARAAELPINIGRARHRRKDLSRVCDALVLHRFLDVWAEKRLAADPAVDGRRLARQ